MSYYAFIPREDGRAPLGSSNRVLLKARWDGKPYKTVRGAKKAAKLRLGTDEFVLFSFSNFYDDSTFRLVYNGTEHKNPRP